VLGFFLQGVCLCFLLAGIFLFDLYFRSFDVCLSLFLGHDFKLLGDLSLCPGKYRSHLGDLGRKHINLDSCFLQHFETDDQPLLRLFGVLLLVDKNILVHSQLLQERSGRDIVSSLHGVPELLRITLDTLVNERERLDTLVKHRTKFNPRSYDLSFADTEQGLLWPLAEPVKSAACHKRWELSQTLPEDLTKRRHSDDHVDVPLDSSKILLEHIQEIDWQVLFHAHGLANLVDGFEVFLLVETSHITTVKDVVNVFKHRLIDDLSVDEDE
jgi:hypothetical protein